jgi:ribonuclease R
VSRPEGRARGSRTRTLGRRVATVERRGRFTIAEPLFERGPQAALVRGSREVRPGEIALVDFGPGGARALRPVGSVERARDVVAALLWDRGMRRGFPTPLESEARDAVRVAREAPTARRDLTGLATFTVDPATARDFDDAVSAEPQGDGIHLWIHIADVAAHVRPGGGLDSEALRRGASTYVPGSVEPMLPGALSDDACSLNPGVDRLAVTAEIALDANGRSRSTSFYRSNIRSDARLNYDQLDEVFAGRSEPPPQVAGPLALARAAAATLADRRPVGSLEIESFEPEFSFDPEGAVSGARSVPQTEAHKLIEHLMILANERVAELLERRRVPTLYRVHEPPDPQRTSFLVEQLASLDIPTPPLPERPSASEAGELVGEISRMVAREAARRGHGRDAYTSLVLRSLKQAYYSHRNLGHAGLGSPAYVHFTSPIRRYPDLVAHRALLSAIGAGEEEPEPERVRDAGWRSSEREREAAAVERDADRVCACFLLGRELFESGWKREFEGEVSGVIGAGAFVRFGGDLGDVYEGLLPSRLLRGERFDLNETETALVGRRSGRAISLGDPIRVRVDSVDAPRGRVDLVEAVESDAGRHGLGRRRRGGRRG